MPSTVPEERSLTASIAANERWAHEPDRSAATAEARAAFDSKFENEVDPDRVLDPVERAKRAANARQAHYKRMALASSRARRAKREAAVASDIGDLS